MAKVVVMVSAVAPSKIRLPVLPMVKRVVPEDEAVKISCDSV